MGESVVGTGRESGDRMMMAALSAASWKRHTAGGHQLFTSTNHKAVPPAPHNNNYHPSAPIHSAPHTGPVRGAKSPAANLIILCRCVCPAAGIGMECVLCERRWRVK